MQRGGVQSEDRACMKVKLEEGVGKGRRPKRACVQQKVGDEFFPNSRLPLRSGCFVLRRRRQSPKTKSVATYPRRKKRTMWAFPLAVQRVIVASLFLSLSLSCNSSSRGINTAGVRSCSSGNVFVQQGLLLQLGDDARHQILNGARRSYCEKADVGD